jgi:sulfhydrogenase subunit alpha
MTTTIAVHHLARIEGHAGINVVLDGGAVERAEFNVFEGIRLFEGLLRGHTAAEAPAIVSRVCAICSHGHAITAIHALEKAMGVRVSPQTRRLRELAQHGAAIESHALHLFCLALPDLMGHPSVVSLAGANRDAVAMALRLKKLGNTIQEIVGGRAVHPVNYVIGGFGRLPSFDDLLRLRAALRAGLDDCDRAVALLAGVPIPAFVDEPVRCAALVCDDDSYFFGETMRLADGGDIPVEEYRRLTNERTVPHSHAKHSRHDGRSYMVGALARLAVGGARIGGRAREAWRVLGPTFPCRNIVMNNVAQAIEVVYSVEQALEIVNGFLDGGLADERPAPYEVRPGRAAAASEVPRGTLFHYYEVGPGGLIAAADVITPTAQNFANAEDQFRATVRDRGPATEEELRHRLEIVARAYDPCVSCSVHVIRGA